MANLALIGIGILPVLALLVILYASGIHLPKKYLDPWERSYLAKFEDPRVKVIACGFLAPSSHNVQPWKARLDENETTFTLFVDTERLLPEVDPPSRQIMVSQGTFLENVRIGAEHLGYSPNIDLFPDGEIDSEGSVSSMISKPVARVSLLGPGENDGSPLYDAIFERVTVRTPYLDQPLTDDQIGRLQSLSDEPNVSVLIFQNEEDLEEIRDLAVQGVEIESSLAGPMGESGDLFRINERQKNRDRDGLTLDSQGMPGALQLLVEGFGTIVPLGDEKMAETWRKGEVDRIGRTPAYAMIITEGNSRTDQVRAGMVYERLQLAGIGLGVSMQPVSQILEEYPEMEALYEEVHESFAGDNRTIQMLVRIGVAEKKVGHSPRRDVLDLLEWEGE